MICIATQLGQGLIHLSFGGRYLLGGLNVFLITESMKVWLALDKVGKWKERFPFLCPAHLLLSWLSCSTCFSPLPTPSTFYLFWNNFRFTEKLQKYMEYFHIPFSQLPVVLMTCLFNPSAHWHVISTEHVFLISPVTWPNFFLFLWTIWQSMNGF